MTNGQLQTAVEIAVGQAIQKAEARIPNFKMAEFPELSFDLRGTTAGSATPVQNLLSFNMVLLRENTEKFLAQTVPHEVAHLVEYLYFGGWDITRTGRRRVHGERWKRIMRLLDCDPNRCHTYDTTNVKTRKQTRYTYKCGCRTHQIATTTHNRIQRNAKQYKCKTCRQRIVLA